MKTSNFWKKTPVRVISAIVLFVVFISAIIFVVSYPYTKIYSNSNNYDTAFIGASQTQKAIDPEIVDDELESKSYVLATVRCTMQGRIDQLEKALQQDSLKTVVLDVSHYCLTSTFNEWVTLDDRVVYFSKISGVFNRADIAFKSFNFFDDEHDRLFAEMIYEGLSIWKDIFNGEYEKISSRRGYSPKKSEDQSFTKKQAIKKYNSVNLNEEYPFDESNEKYIQQIIDICKENDVQLIIVTLPLSESLIWRKDGWQYGTDWLTSLCSKNDVPYFDFNLIKNRSDYFDDSYSFSDEEHLSKKGSKVMSKIISDTIYSVNENTELPYEFYENYKEAKENSTYAKMISEN